MALHSLVIPVFNEEEGLQELHKRLHAECIQPLEKLGDRCEIYFINDGSVDRSASILNDLFKTDPSHIRVAHLSRNFGHQAAISAGLDIADGDTVTVLDADLQDPPSAVLAMIEEWKKGYEVVYAIREKREREGLFKKISASCFYYLLRRATKLDIPADAGDFRLMGRRSVLALRSLREQHRLIRGLVKWVGFKSTSISYVRQGRFAGETKYPFHKMLALAWDGLTGFSLLPIRVATLVGLSLVVLSIGIAFWVLYLRLVLNETVHGWSSIMIAVLLTGGGQLFCVGILGEYVGRTFEESKKRPLYLIDTLHRPS